MGPIANHAKKDVEDAFFSQSLHRNGCNETLDLDVRRIVSLANAFAADDLLADVLGEGGGGGVVEDEGGERVSPVAVLSRSRSSMALSESKPRSWKARLVSRVVGLGWPSTAAVWVRTNSMSRVCCSSGVSPCRRWASVDVAVAGSVVSRSNTV